MKTITMRELLHNSAGIMRLVEHGETLTLTKRGRPVARLIPEPKPTSRKVQMPDFAARARAYCGDFVMSDAAYEKMREADEFKP